MSFAMLKQNARILEEVAKNYENLIMKRNNDDTQIKNFRKQFLYLLASIDRLVKQEKNAG